MRGRDKLKKYNRIIVFLTYVIGLFPKSVLIFFFQRTDNIRGNIGILIRYLLIKNISLECGENVSIHRGCYILNITNIKFGENISIHPLCYLDGYGGIEIGSNTSIAHGVSIMSSSHTFDNNQKNIKDQVVDKKRTIIGENVWIGAKSMIMGGIYVNNRAIIGASSVVTKSVSENTIVGGNPAKIIKYF
ncbi:acyltransferase [Chryseobacterium sp. CFBP8996]|uniref:acyltransferase n=1 Tax=Chryseobacterium sp. CFBP8996 TaxID=3096529 RepID=UPI002A6B88B9|nr:acyltransferase [Chryseobacterium sp. CFBP8996]MDY0933056.1 acyltransferase [Chryseobacterium sp. CFBP8996]